MGRTPGDGLDLVAGGIEVGNDLVSGQRIEMGVGVGMAHNLVSGVRQGLDRFRVFVHPIAYHEERGPHLVFAQNVDERLGVLVAPG